MESNKIVRILVLTDEQFKELYRPVNAVVTKLRSLDQIVDVAGDLLIWEAIRLSFLRSTSLPTDSKLVVCISADSGLVSFADQIGGDSDA